MTFADRLRTVRATRLAGSASGPSQAAAARDRGTSQRHPAMQGIDVPPVHGHHCICDRCTPATRRDAA
jgi:hypothetical protein